MCADYKKGLGLYCEGTDPIFHVLTPLSELSRDTNTAYLKSACIQSCWCQSRRADDDVAVAIDGQGANGHSVTDNHGNVDTNDDDDFAMIGSFEEETGVGGSSDLQHSTWDKLHVDPNLEKGVHCGGYYGHPTTNDCYAALEVMDDMLGTQINNMHDFEWPGAPLATARRDLIIVPWRTRSGELT